MLYLHFKYQVLLSEQQKNKTHCSLSLAIMLQVLPLRSRWTPVDLSPDNLSTSEFAIHSTSVLNENVLLHSLASSCFYMSSVFRIVASIP